MPTDEGEQARGGGCDGGSGVSQKREQLRLGDDLQGWKQTSGFGSHSLLFGNYGEVRKDRITYKVEAFNREYVKTFTRKAAGALEALEEGLMRDPTPPLPVESAGWRQIPEAPESRCQAAAPGWASRREPGRGSERQCAGSQLCLRKSETDRPHGPRATRRNQHSTYSAKGSSQ